MIFDLLFNVFFSFASGFLAILPDITWSVDSSAFEIFFGILETVFYLFPMGTVANILSITCSLLAFRALIALIRSIWDLLPLV